MLEFALAAAARGFAVFPIKPRAKSPPLLNGWPARATTDEAEIKQLWVAVPNANVGIHCRGLLVIDIDPRKGGKDAIAKLELIEGLPPTLRTLTPSGGEHRFYRLPAEHPGVANTVGVLGPGLDLRSTGGYVVAPGSVVDSGSYTVLEDAPIADAPVWLLERCGTARTRDAAAVPDRGDPIDAAPEIVERARQWLAGQLPAFEGQGGDARTFTVACGLRDYGVSQGQALALLEGWNATCVPPWAPEDLAVKVANAYRYAENEPGAKAALPADFPIVPNLSTIVPKTATSNLIPLSAFAALEARGAGYVVKGMLQRASYAEVFGSPGAGKTFVALDLSYHVAAGQAWLGHKVHAGPVLYLAYEGAGGLVKRAQALRQKYGEKEVPLYIHGTALNMRKLEGRAEAGSLVKQLPDKPALIVFDTFAHALMGGDENSAQDVGEFNKGVLELIRWSGACVLIIHHSGKDKSKGARGSSALLAALDTEIEVDDWQISARKQRDVEIAAPVGFKLVPVMVGMDSDGDEVTSCVVEPAGLGPKLTRLAGKARLAFEMLSLRWPDNKPVHSSDWKEACAEFLSARRLNGDFSEIKIKLLRSQHIVENKDGTIQRRLA